MIIYDKVQRFHPVTGKPFDKWIQKEIRCDYTGRVLDYGNFGPESFCTYNLNYGDHDPCFGASGDEYKLGKDFGIEVFPFMSQKYHFYSSSGDAKKDYAEWQMMEEVFAVRQGGCNCRNEKSEWYRCYTFDAICRQARVRTARKLIESKEITPEQLQENNA